MNHAQIVVTAVDGAVMASNPWNIKVVYTPDDGANNPTYTAVALTITCEVTAFTTSNTPTSQTYDVFASTKIVSLTGVIFTQSPVCGYTFSGTYSYASSPASSFINGGTTITPSAEIYSASGSDAGSITVTMSTTINIDAAQG
jgi:hypothetical protein